MIGKRLAQYEITEKIGAGGMGEVYRARDTRLDRDVALKILPQEFAHDTERSERFEREAKAVAALSHPNILSIYDFGSDGGQAFAVTELLEGESLSDRILKGPIPQRKTIELAVQLANGLAAAHSRGIIHRDLKPANIFITRDGRTKILDFGLARVDDGADPNLTQSPTVGVQTDPGRVMGTVGYMSPEQVRGEPVDARSDIFSLGAVLYEMLSGNRAFGGDTAADAIGSVLRDEPSSLHGLDSSLTESLDRVVQHCMEKNPEERFQSASDLGFALATLSSSSQPSITSVATPPARHRGLPRLALIILAVLGWAAAATWFVQLQTRISEPFVPPRLSTLTYSGRDWAPDVSPNGDLIAFVSDRDGASKVWIKQVGGGGAASITDGPDDIPRFSPDGSQVLFVRDEGGIRNLYRTTVVGAQPRKMLTDVVEADWSPDGSQVAFIRMRAASGDNIFIIGIADAQTGSERILVEVTNRVAYGIRFSPTGERLAVNETSLTGNVADESYIDLIDTENGAIERHALTDWGGPYTAVDWAPSGRSVVVGQAGDLLSHASGSPGQIMEYNFDTGERAPLFWTTMRIPRGGWGFSSVAVLNSDQVVLDNDAVQAQLHEYGWPGTPDEGSKRVLTTSMGRDRQPSPSPDGSQVIFSSNRSGNIDLWIVDRASERVRQVTDDPADDWDPAFSPDGRNLLWSSNRSGHMEIWMAAVDGSRAHQVSNDGIDAENPTMTRGGQWVVYSSSSDEKRGIWRIRPDGSDATNIAPGAFILPEVSPDGRYVAFAQLRNLNFVICVAEIESAETVPFEIELATTERHVNVTFGRCRWTPDGKRLVFLGQDEFGRSGVYVQDFVPGSNTFDTRRQVVGFTREHTTESLGVSPDGKSIIISAMYDRRGLNLADQVNLRLWK